MIFLGKRREGRREEGRRGGREGGREVPFPFPRVEGGSCPPASVCFPPVHVEPEEAEEEEEEEEEEGEKERRE